MEKNQDLNKGEGHEEVGLPKQHVVDATKWTQSITKVTQDATNFIVQVLFMLFIGNYFHVHTSFFHTCILGK